MLLCEYLVWEKKSVADPRVATMDQLIHGMTQIVAVEGPIIASRIFSSYARAGGLNRISCETKRKFLKAMEMAIKKKMINVMKEFDVEPESWILRLPNQSAVKVRTIGDRSIHEVPIFEIAEVMLDIHIQYELLSKEELYRKTLGVYGFARLTDSTMKRLDFASSAYL